MKKLSHQHTGAQFTAAVTALIRACFCSSLDVLDPFQDLNLASVTVTFELKFFRCDCNTAFCKTLHFTSNTDGVAFAESWTEGKERRVNTEKLKMSQVQWFIHTKLWFEKRCFLPL